MGVFVLTLQKKKQQRKQTELNQIKNSLRARLFCSNEIFTITAEIHARSLANFYCQYADRHRNLKFMRRVSGSLLRSRY